MQNTTNPNKKPLVVIVDGDGELIGKMLEALAAESIDVRVVPVHPGNDYRFIVRRIEHYEPDILLVADVLSDTIRGHVLLAALGDKFYARLGGAGNPHVISTSTSIPPELTALIGGLFERKMNLVSAKLEERKGAYEHLVAVVQGSIERIKA